MSSLSKGILRSVCSLLMLGSLACKSKEDDSWIAQVDQVKIPLAVLKNEFNSRVSEQPDATREDILNQELNRLVTEQVILNRASMLEIEISDEEIQQRISFLHGEHFQSRGGTLVDDVRREMLLERTALVDLADRVQVSESALVLYFEENREKLRRPEQVRIRQILVEDAAKAERLHAELKDGADFVETATKHSIAPEANRGGLLAPFASGDMPEVFEVAFELKPGGVSDVIESPYGFHIFRLEAKDKPHDPELDEVREQLLLEVQRKRLAELHRDWFRALRRNSKIRVNEKLLETLR